MLHVSFKPASHQPNAPVTTTPTTRPKISAERLTSEARAVRHGAERIACGLHRTRLVADLGNRLPDGALGFAVALSHGHFAICFLLKAGAVVWRARTGTLLGASRVDLIGKRDKLCIG